MADPVGDRVSYREPCGNVIVVGNADRAQTAGNSRFGDLSGSHHPSERVVWTWMSANNISGQ